MEVKYNKEDVKNIVNEFIGIPDGRLTVNGWSNIDQKWLVGVAGIKNYMDCEFTVSNPLYNKGINSIPGLRVKINKIARLYFNNHYGRPFIRSGSPLKDYEDSLVRFKDNLSNNYGNEQRIIVDNVNKLVDLVKKHDFKGSNILSKNLLSISNDHNILHHYNDFFLSFMIQEIEYIRSRPKQITAPTDPRLTFIDFEGQLKSNISQNKIKKILLAYINRTSDRTYSKITIKPQVDAKYIGEEEREHGEPFKNYDYTLKEVLLDLK